jgi:acyl-CoA thioesterase-1
LVSWKLALFFFLLFACSAQAQIVCLGASNMAGYGLEPSQSYPAQLQTMLKEHGSTLRVTNAGVSGDTAEGMLRRLSSAVPEGTKTVILQLGAGNDLQRGYSRAEYQSSMKKIAQELRSRGIRTIDAHPLVNAARGSGLVQADHIHLDAAGHRRVATQLLDSLRD